MSNETYIVTFMLTNETLSSLHTVPVKTTMDNIKNLLENRFYGLDVTILEILGLTEWLERATIDSY